MRHLNELLAKVRPSNPLDMRKVRKRTLSALQKISHVTVRWFYCPGDCGGQRNLSVYCGSGARTGTDSKVTTDEMDSLPHADEAEPGLIIAVIRPEPDAIIPNYQYEVSTVSCQTYVNGLRLAVLGYVVKSFLRHTKKGQGNRAVQFPRDTNTGAIYVDRVLL